MSVAMFMVITSAGRPSITTRLLAGAAEGHLHVDLLVVLGLPVFLEGWVVVQKSRITS